MSEQRDPAHLRILLDHREDEITRLLDIITTLVDDNYRLRGLLRELESPVEDKA